MTRTILALALSSCVATDLLDGDVERASACCFYLGGGPVRSCVADLLDAGRCLIWECPTTSGAVCRDPDGEVVIPPKTFCELTPDVDPEWCAGGEDGW